MYQKKFFLIQKYFKLNDNANIVFHNLWNDSESELKWIFTSLNVYVKNEDRLKTMISVFFLR